MAISAIFLVFWGGMRIAAAAAAETQNSTLKILSEGSIMEREWARQYALSKAVERVRAFEQRFARGAEKLNMSAADTNLLHRLINSPRLINYLPLANHHVRLRAMDALAVELHNVFERDAPDFHLLTLFWDEGVTWEHEPHVNVGGLALKARDALSKLGVEAFCTIEVEARSRLAVGEPSRRLAFHVHGVCWTRGGPFLPTNKAEVLADMDGGQAFRCTTDASPAVFAHQATTWKSVAGLAEYLWKANDRLKKLSWRETLGRSRQLDAPRAEYSPCLAVRFMDVHSRLSLDNVAFGVGGAGTAVHQGWRSRVDESMPSCGLTLCRYDIEQFWRRAYRRTKHPKLSTYRLGWIGTEVGDFSITK